MPCLKCTECDFWLFPGCLGSRARVRDISSGGGHSPLISRQHFRGNRLLPPECQSVSWPSGSHLLSARRGRKRSSEAPLTQAVPYFRRAALPPSVPLSLSEFPGSGYARYCRVNPGTGPNRSLAGSGRPSPWESIFLQTG